MIRKLISRTELQIVCLENPDIKEWIANSDKWKLIVTIFVTLVMQICKFLSLLCNRSKGRHAVLLWGGALRDTLRMAV